MNPVKLQLLYISVYKALHTYRSNLYLINFWKPDALHRVCSSCLVNTDCVNKKMNWSSTKWRTTQNRSALMTRHVDKCLKFTGPCTVDPALVGFLRVVGEVWWVVNPVLGQLWATYLVHIMDRNNLESRGRRPIRQHSTGLLLCWVLKEGLG